MILILNNQHDKFQIKFLEIFSNFYCESNLTFHSFIKILSLNSQPKQPPATEEEEWKDFEEEKKDYTGLKLGQLTITDDDKNQQNLGGDSDNEGQYYLDSGSSDNPWKKSDPSAPQEAPKQPKAPAPTGGYVAPHLRVSNIYCQFSLVLFTNTNFFSLFQGPKKAKKGIAPDLNNQDFFPSLGTEKAPELKSKKDDFEEVKHGGRIKSDANVTIPVSLGNRFTSLSNDTSQKICFVSIQMSFL